MKFGPIHTEKVKAKAEKIKEKWVQSKKTMTNIEEKFRFCFLFRLVRMGLKQGRTGRVPSLIASLLSPFTCSLSTCRLVASSVRADGVSINLDRNRYKWSAVGNFRLLSCAYKRKINRANLNHVSNLFLPSQDFNILMKFSVADLRGKIPIFSISRGFRQTL